MDHAKESAQRAMFLALRVLAPTSQPGLTPTENVSLAPVRATSGAGMGTTAMPSSILGEAVMVLANACRKKKNV